MLLTSLIKDLEFIKIKGDLSIDVSGIAYDSREVAKNGVFVAMPGFKMDGHDFIQQAIDMGANTIIVEKDLCIEDHITVLKVTDSRKALAKIASNFYNKPTEKLNMVGITGTNGKTSITYFIKSIFDQVNRSTGLIGTIGTMIENKIMQNKNTTPESLNLQATFNNMLKVNTENCIMEVSSHSLSLNRVAYCEFNTGIFTNLTPDHLELHENMEEYFNAKAELFEMTKDYNIINVDDEYGRRLIERVENYDTKLVTYGIENEADIYATDIDYSIEFTKYTLNTPKGSIEITVNIPGGIYVYNSLAAIACAYCNGIDLKDIQKGIKELKSIKGRFEVIYKDQDYRIIVDFAHTEDGLEKTLTTIKPFARGRIILVFGVYAAPGEKGSGKRRAMGKVAAKYSDFAVVTSDNPKEQDPNLIIQEIVEAIKEENGKHIAIVDRKEAIKYAIGISNKDDIILIAGKGHETAQAIGKEEIPFNETEIVTEIIKTSREMQIS